MDATAKQMNRIIRGAFQGETQQLKAQPRLSEEESIALERARFAAAGRADAAARSTGFPSEPPSMNAWLRGQHRYARQQLSAEIDAAEHGF